MARTWMDEVTVLQAGGTDAFNSRQITRRRAFIRADAARTNRAATRNRPLRVLIVDDDHDTSDGLIMLVGLWGHTAQLAYGGDDALRAVAIKPPDVVLLDIEMPSVNGCDVARRMRLDSPGGDRLIIAITGRAGETRRRECSEAGIDLVLLKPVDPLVLETLLMLECQLANRLREGSAAPVGAAPAIGIGL